MTDKSRAAFEAWAKAAYLDCNTKVTSAWGVLNYLPHIESMWSGWQASRKQALEEAARLFPSKNPMPGNDIAGLIRSLLK